MNFQIFLGTYERLLIGLDASFSSDTGNNHSKDIIDDTLSNNISCDLKMSVGYAAHIACIKSVAVGGAQYLASGGVDEIIKLYDLKKKREIGTLHSHSGTISALAFHSNSHLLSASTDGVIQIYRTKDFALLKSLKGHENPITSLSIHPSGKVCLSIDDHSYLKMWDLRKGRCAYTTRLSSSSNTTTTSTITTLSNRGASSTDLPERILWNIEGSGYAILYLYHVDIYSTADPDTIIQIKATGRQKFLSLAYLSSNIIVVGCESGHVSLYDTTQNITSDTDTETCIHKPRFTFKAHEFRVKALDIHRHSTSCSTESRYADVLVTASTDGTVCMWDTLELLKGEGEIIEPLAKHSTGTRITCLTLHSPVVVGEEQVEQVEEIEEQVEVDVVEKRGKVVIGKRERKQDGKQKRKQLKRK